MIKAVALLRRKPGLSRAELIAYYETRHAPLIQRLLPEIIDYRRNYIEHDGAFSSPSATIDFDVMTEVWFEDRAAYERFLEAAAVPETARAIAEDEEHVFDRSATRMFVVDVIASGHHADPMLATLVAERAVREGLARFARLLDTKAWDDLGTVFAEDLTFDYGMGESSGIAALSKTMRRFLDVCGPSQHLLGSITVELNPDLQSATSRAYVQARHQRPNNPNGPVFDTNGEYIDRWERRADGWRIVRRDALWQTHSGDPAVIWQATGG